MDEVDELDINPFFKALQSTFLDFYERAQENCYVVCVPQASSLAGVTISQKFVETHILRPSPYFQGQYMTIHSANSKTIHWNEAAQEFITGEGFSEENRAKIINEEQAYNKHFKPYKILIIDKPLDPRFLAVQTNSIASTSDIYSPKTSLSECREFLKSFPEYGTVLLALDENLKQFNTNYMVLKDYLDDAGKRLQSFSESASEKCFKCSKQKLWSDPKFRDVLNSAVESYVLGCTHQKVFPIICEKFYQDDDLLLHKCKQLSGIRANDLGVRSDFSCPLPTAVVELAHLDSLKTPLEKLYCLKSTLDNVTEGINSYIVENQPPGINTEDGVPCLTSDDLIPILVTVLAQAKCGHIASNVLYMENFYWAAGTKDRDNLSYCLVTFKAAVQYIKNTDFSNLMHKKAQMKTEMSIDELMAATKKVTLSQDAQASPSSHRRTESGPSTRIDRQLQKISKMLDESSNEWAAVGHKYTTPRSVFGDRHQNMSTPDIVPLQDPSRRRNQLGEFLSSLQDDVFDVSYGKQA